MSRGKRIDRRLVLVCLALAAAVLAVFRPLADNGFINIDDNVYLTANPHLKGGFTWPAVLWAFTDFRYASNWHPLTWLSHLADVSLFGLDPRGHHLMSLAIHLATALLLLLVLRAYTSALWRAALVAALFAVHPLHVESVAWAAERKDVLSAFFWMLTLAAYLRSVRKPGIGPYLGTLACFLLGLLAKPMLVTLPLVLLLLDWWPLGRILGPGGRAGGDPRLRPTPLRAVLLEKVPFLLLAVGSSVMTLVAQRDTTVSLARVPLDERAANAVVSYVRYLGTTVWPRGLAVVYPHPGPGQNLWLAAAAALALVAATVLLFRFRRRLPFLTVGWLWFLGTLVPVIGLVQAGLQARADRYTYLPLCGIFVAVAWGLAEAVARFPAPHVVRRLAVVATLGTLGGLAAAAHVQTTYWRDSITLLDHALRVTEGNWAAESSMGAALSTQGKVEESYAHFREAIRLAPSSQHVRLNLGKALLAQNKLVQAIAEYQEALRLSPQDARPAFGLGVAHFRLGNLPAAESFFRRALALQPAYSEAHNNLGYLLICGGRRDEGIVHLTEAVRADPTNAEANLNLAEVLHEQKRFEEALRHYRETLRLRPGSAEARRGEERALRRLPAVFPCPGAAG